jgi:hypothetical protein
MGRWGLRRRNQDDAARAPSKVGAGGTAKTVIRPLAFSSFVVVPINPGKTNHSDAFGSFFGSSHTI